MKLAKIGQNIRDVRLGQKKNIKVIAKMTGFSCSYISQVERDIVNPSLSALDKLADALSVPITVFFTPPGNPNPLVKHSERGKIESINFGMMNIETVVNSPESKTVALYILKTFGTDTGVPQKIPNIFLHRGEEFIYMLEGTVEYFLEEQRYLLEQGDCIYYNSSIQHYGSVLTESCTMLVGVVASQASSLSADALNRNSAQS
jgi:transcriptional regulator with XRE-family HTH domain